MHEDACTDYRALDAEVALGVVVGRERAQVLAHLNRCCRCQDAVAELTRTTDRLIELIPDAEAPPTLERRVVAALPAPAPRQARHKRPRIAPIIVGVMATFAGLIGAASPGSTSSADPASVAAVLSAPVLTDGHPVGEAYLYPGTPGWLRLEIDGTIVPAGNPITCTVLRSDQTPHVIGVFTAAPGHDEWSATVPADAHPVAGATLTDRNGTTLGAAHFGRPAAPVKTATTRRPIQPAAVSPDTDNGRSRPHPPQRQPAPPTAAPHQPAGDLLQQHARPTRATDLHTIVRPHHSDEPRLPPRPPEKRIAAPASSPSTPNAPPSRPRSSSPPPQGHREDRAHARASHQAHL